MCLAGLASRLPAVSFGPCPFSYPGFSEIRIFSQEPQKLNNDSLSVPVDLGLRNSLSLIAFLHRKEVIQPHLPIRLPCYDFTPVIGHTVASALPKVKLPASGATNSHGVTGGVYKTRERIHRGMLIRDY